MDEKSYFDVAPSLIAATRASNLEMVPEAGGRTTNSPPANVKTLAILEENEDARVLASGIDSLVISLDVEWSDMSFLEKLRELKSQAQVRDDKQEEGAVTLTAGSGRNAWLCTIEPHATKGGWHYLLTSGDMTWKLTHRQKPSTKPSIMVEFRSEYLWSDGAVGAVERVREIVAAEGGVIRCERDSRRDQCVDILVRDRDFTREMEDHVVSYATDTHAHATRREFSGITIGGGGQLQARVYHKSKEIEEKSKKFWMYKVWGIDSKEGIPAGHVVVRVEFQLRREGMVELGMKKLRHALEGTENSWAYFTKKWLKFQDDPTVHHTMQRTLRWWKAVQKGWMGFQNACPSVRARAMTAKKDQLVRQITGCLVSLAALFGATDKKGGVSFEKTVDQYKREAKRMGLAEIAERALERLHKFHKNKLKFAEAQIIWRSLNLMAGDDAPETYIGYEPGELDFN